LEFVDADQDALAVTGAKGIALGDSVERPTGIETAPSVWKA
jgi:hypothetical protein